ncbi:MAG: 50S ribosomal protein L4 [Oscillospiraceae bacterium]|nr:50S ribosomal protein L4 [Oscillospiraceae bacterium]
MPQANVYNMAGEKIGTVDLSDAIFGIEPNPAVLHTAVKNHLANRRQGTQSTLTRAEVRGGGRKPWRQKGTGRARAGTTRAPHWTHGGVAFAPKPRDYSYTINKKVKRLAMKSALADKAQETAIYVIDSLTLGEIKTKQIVNLLNKLELGGKKAMVVTNERDENVYKSARNIPGVNVTFGTIMSPYEIINARALVIDKTALSKIEEVFA